jgi:hypothetical protein
VPVSLVGLLADRWEVASTINSLFAPVVRLVVTVPEVPVVELDTSIGVLWLTPEKLIAAMPNFVVVPLTVTTMLFVPLAGAAKYHCSV